MVAALVSLSQGQEAQMASKAKHKSYRSRAGKAKEVKMIQNQALLLCSTFWIAHVAVRAINSAFRLASTFW